MAEIVEREVPEVAAAVSQPIQMRTNELIAGVRSDVGGPDLRPGPRQAAASSASRRSPALRGVPGVVDVRAEQGAGLTLPAHPPGPGAPRALRPHRRGRQHRDRDDGGRPRRSATVFESDRRFAHGGQDRARLSGRPRRRARAAAQVDARPDRAARRRRRRDARDRARRWSTARSSRGASSSSSTCAAATSSRSSRRRAPAVARSVALPTGYRIEWGGQFQQLRERAGAPRGRRAARARR